MLNVECLFRLPKNTLNSRIGVLQIRRRVALQREHLVPAENIITLPVRQQVGVFYRAEADDARDFAALRLRQLRIFFGNDFERPFLRLVEQIGQFHRLAAAGFERLPVLAQYGTEPGMSQFESGMLGPEFGIGLSPFMEHGEDLLKVQLLAAVGDVRSEERRVGKEWRAGWS